MVTVLRHHHHTAYRMSKYWIEPSSTASDSRSLHNREVVTDPGVANLFKAEAEMYLEESMDQAGQIIKTLKDLKVEIGERFKVENLSVFGSFARSEQGEKSDIDILVEFKQVPLEVRETKPEVPWSEMAGMRDRRLISAEQDNALNPVRVKTGRVARDRRGVERIWQS